MRFDYFENVARQFFFINKFYLFKTMSIGFRILSWVLMFIIRLKIRLFWIPNFNKNELDVNNRSLSYLNLVYKLSFDVSKDKELNHNSWEERLRISETVKFGFIMLKNVENIGLQSSPILNLPYRNCVPQLSIGNDVRNSRTH